MLVAELDGVTELSSAEAEQIDGGNALHVARYIASCFGAGFAFGYNQLGPRLFGE